MSNHFMKTNTYNASPTSPFFTVIVLCSAILFSSCAQKINFLNSSVVPAARGFVQVKKDNNENYAISLQLDKLAEVERVTPGSTYIIWMNTAQNGTKNIGQLNSGTSTFSNKLKASFNTVTPFQPTRIFITAEQDGNAAYPSDKIIVTTDSF
jgi:hypothetical protein